MDQILLLTWFLLPFPFSEPSWSIIMDRVEVPEHPVVGTSVDLICHYKLENTRAGKSEDIYSVKWYKNGKEFYRYVWSILSFSSIYIALKNCILESLLLFSKNVWVLGQTYKNSKQKFWKYILQLLGNFKATLKHENGFFFFKFHHTWENLGMYYI